MMDISQLSHDQQVEIADYIRKDNLAVVNKNIEAVVPKNSFYTKYGKRMIDIILSFLALVLVAPINIIIAIVTFFDVGMPIIFKQKRIGRNGVPFTLYKFRNMTNKTDAKGELLPAAQRVTKWGKFVRKTSLDELLNFISIFKGDMSIIGPRPITEFYLERLNDRHKGMYLIRPGLECPTPHKVDHFLSWQERFDNYVWYVENCSFFLDIKLCFRVVAIALDNESSTIRSSMGYGSFMGYDKSGAIIYNKQVPDKYVKEFLKKHNYMSLEEAISDRYKA